LLHSRKSFSDRRSLALVINYASLAASTQPTMLNEINAVDNQSTEWKSAAFSVKLKIKSFHSEIVDGWE